MIADDVSSWSETFTPVPDILDVRDSRSRPNESEITRSCQYDSSEVRKIVSRIGDYLGNDTEGALRLLLEQVKLHRQPLS